MNVYLPQYLYKYFSLHLTFNEMFFDKFGTERQKNSFDALRDILINNKIYYSKSKIFNDPFEFDGIFLKLSKQMRDKIRFGVIDKLHSNGSLYINKNDNHIVIINSDKELDEQEIETHNNPSSLFRRCGFISLCKSNDIISMWSHYANSHNGICLRFKCINDEFYSIGTSGRVVEVIYDNNIIQKELCVNSPSKNVFEKISRKSECFKYEEEFRVFKIPSNFDKDDASGNHKFNSSLVNAIYFGLRTEDEDKEKIIQIVNEAKHKIELYSPVKDKKLLKINFEKIQG